MTDQEILHRQIEAQMVNASAQMGLLERLDAMNERDYQMFIEGYIYRSQVVEALNEIYFGKGMIE